MESEEEEEAGLAFRKNTVDCKAKVKGNGQRTYERQIYFQNSQMVQSIGQILSARTVDMK